jgi:hypothetical protein
MAVKGTPLDNGGSGRRREVLDMAETSRPEKPSSKSIQASSSLTTEDMVSILNSFGSPRVEKKKIPSLLIGIVIQRLHNCWSLVRAKLSRRS